MSPVLTSYLAEEAAKLMKRALAFLDQAALDLPAVHLQHAIDMLDRERKGIDPLAVPDADAVAQRQRQFEEDLRQIEEAAEPESPRRRV
jgi:hypothetical protein